MESSKLQLGAAKGDFDLRGMSGLWGLKTVIHLELQLALLQILYDYQTGNT